MTPEQRPPAKSRAPFQLVRDYGVLAISTTLERLYHVQRLHELSEVAMNNASATARAALVEGTKRSASEYTELLLEHGMADWAFPQIQRAALFLMAYGTLEHGLIRTCDLVHYFAPQRVARTDLRGTGIRQARTFLTKVAALASPAEPQWNELLEYGEVRNLLIHARGEVRENRRKIVRRLEQRDVGLTLTQQEQQIELEASFNSVFRHRATAFLEEMLRAWQERWQADPPSERRSHDTESVTA